MSDVRRRPRLSGDLHCHTESVPSARRLGPYASPPFLGLELILVVGAVAAASGWRPGSILLLVGLVGLLLGHLALGVQGYNRAMSRAWPRVPALDHDEDW